MAGLPYAQTNETSPESLIDDQFQKGMQDIQQRYDLQWDEINKRGTTLGQRRQTEMFDELDAKVQQEALKFSQLAQQQQDRLVQLDTLAQQGGFDATEAKWRMTVGAEEAAAMFPSAGRSVAAQFGELDVYENRLKKERGAFMLDPGGKRIKEASKFWFSEKKTKPSYKVWDPDLDPKQDKETGEWASGGYRTAGREDTQRMFLLNKELRDVRSRKQELMSQPDIATRVRGTMLRTKRDPKNDSLTTRVQKAAGAVTSKPPEQPAPKRQAVQPTAEQLKKAGTKDAYETGVKLGYWE